jgi:hypothetical protein
MTHADRRGMMLKVFVAIMIAHWLEHIVQAYQVYALGYERHHAMGLLGQFYPWLVHSEWMHFGYAVLTWLGLVILRGFSGSARVWGDTAVIVQIWHLFEHTLLFVQAQGGFTLWGANEPTSYSSWSGRGSKLHLFYNFVVTVPIVIAMVVPRRGRSRASQIVTAAGSV